MTQACGVAMKPKQTLQIIWAAILASSVLYAGLGVVIAGRMPPKHAPAILLPILWVVSLPNIAIGWSWAGRAVFYARAASGGGPGTARPGQARPTAGGLVSGLIAGMAMLESAAVCGLVLMIVGPSDTANGLALITASLVSLVMFRARLFPEAFAAMDRLERAA